MRPLLPALLLLCACPSPGDTKKTEEAAPPPSDCDVSMDNLDGTAWVHDKPQASGPDKPSPVTRIRFRKDGDKLLADYSASSLSAMYTYECTAQGSLLTCKEADPHYKEWCRAWAAVNDGVCDPAALAPVIHEKAEDIAEAAKIVNEEFKKAKGDELAQMKKDYNSPNNKVRGKLRVALNKGSCKLTIEDKFQAMFEGRVQEFENAVSNQKFSKATEPYTFEGCEDLEVARAITPEGATARAYPAGTYEFESFLPNGTKAEGSCTYTADIWKDWLPSQKGITGEPDKGNVRWSVKVPIDGAGPHVVYFDRFKTCGDKQERIGFSCAKIHIE